MLVLIYIDRFTEELLCVQEISEIIQRNYNGVWKSWKKIPEAVRTIMFREFEKKFCWREGDRWLIHKVFEHRGSGTLKNRLHRAHRLNKRPNWIGIEVWNGLLKEWGKDDFTKISTQNKKEKLGYEPDLAESFMHTHSSVNEKGERVWVNERAENTYNAFVAKWKEICSQNLQPMPTQHQVWTEMVGGVNKGLVYGLGGEASFVADGFPSFAKSWPTPSLWETEKSRSLNVQEKDKETELIDVQEDEETMQEEIEDLESRC